MQSNVIGRVQNTHLPLTQPLLPLYEAIINSIDSIEDGERKLDESYIDIYILRQYDTLLVEDDGQEIQNPILGFEIRDNGIGFTNENYRSFNEADSLFKSQRGGKGVGRFLWLKAFEKVEIVSSFANNGSISQRSFTFSLASPNGISNEELRDVEDVELETAIRLLNFHKKYEQRTPHTDLTIAQRIVEHCLEYFVLGNMPNVRLFEQGQENPILLDDLYDALVAEKDFSTIDIKGEKFDLIHFFLQQNPGIKHQICYCANHRVVVTDKIGVKIPNLPPSLPTDEGDAFVYAGYVSSNYLDKHVNQQRTGFEEMPESGFSFPGELSWEDITSTVLSQSQERLSPFTEAARSSKEERIQQYVHENAPEYRHIINNHREQLDTIPTNISDDKLNLQLYEIHRDIEAKLKMEATELLDDGLFSSGEYLSEEQLEQFSHFWKEYNEVGKASLAKYIIHRKLVLSILEKSLQRKNDGKYLLEEAVHEIIFPLRSTSDDMTYDQHNLWILDEKLAYHQYLASDIPLSKYSPLESVSSSRPDLLITFDRAFAAVDDEAPYNSGIVIFEFKRPMRDDYTEDKNPIAQVLKYVQEIKDGKVTDKNGRVLNVPQTTPFFCYIVADITPKLKDQAKYASLRLTPDAGGYFGYNDPIGAYIEIIGFSKLIQDSKKRNRILFEKLNLQY